MVHSKAYDSTDTVIEHQARNTAFNGANNANVSDTNAPDLDSRQLLNRFEMIRQMYDSATTPDRKKRLRKEAHYIKQLIGEHRRKVFFSTGSLVMAIALLVILLQNIGLI